MPRTYTLSHCDFTANLTLTISNIIHLDQVIYLLSYFFEVKFCPEVDATNAIKFCFVFSQNLWIILRDLRGVNNLHHVRLRSLCKEYRVIFALIYNMFQWQLKGWYNKDDVVAQLTEVKGNMCLDVHCYVSGPNPLLDLAAEFRYHIFSKELPLVSSTYNGWCKINKRFVWISQPYNIQLSASICFANWREHVIISKYQFTVLIFQEHAIFQVHLHEYCI